MELLKYARIQWDRVAAAVAALIGFLALLLGYAGTRNTEFVAAQVPYLISGGLTGVFFLGLSATLWISADQRDEWRELRRLSLLISDDLDARLAASELTASSSTTTSVPSGDGPAQPRSAPARRQR